MYWSLLSPFESCSNLKNGEKNASGLLKREREEKKWMRLHFRRVFMLQLVFGLCGNDDGYLVLVKF